LGWPILGDSLYAPAAYGNGLLGLRLWSLTFRDPGSGKHLEIKAGSQEFLDYFGFADCAPDGVSINFG
jgi:23S rRNA-/tRNA-specific pseudouridylate synthase